MKSRIVAGALSIALLCIPLLAQSAQNIVINMLGSYSTGLASVDGSAGETAALRGDRLYVTNARDVSLDIVDVSNPGNPQLIRRVDLKSYGASANSVDVSSKNLIAVAIQAPKKTDPGTIVFLNPSGTILRTAKVGANPDMVVFTPQGDRLLVANEGEPDCYGPGCTDPEGSVSVVTVVPLKPELPVQTIGFTNVTIPAGVRIFGPGATPAQDLEPEYITVSEDGNTAWVTLQENNAVAVLDLKQLRVTAIFPLGFKDHGADGNGLDASDRDNAINIRTYSRVRGMYQPDGIAQFRIGNQTYLVTANEGDARDYQGFAEEARARALSIAQPTLATIPGINDNALLGRLTVTNTPPGGDWDNLYVLGSRSFSIWNATTGAQVWDSGDQFEQILAKVRPANFNSNNTENDFDTRSDNKGPEPEGIAVGSIGGRIYAFVGLERVGGFMVYDITNPTAPTFQQYVNNRNFAGTQIGPDSGPEILRFIKAENNPTGKPILVVANEISGTVTLWSLTPN